MKNPDPKDSTTLPHNYLAQLLVAVGRVEGKVDNQARSHDMLIQILTRSASQQPMPTAPQSSGSIDPQKIHLAERLFNILPTLWQIILWLVPRLVIGWGLAEGWIGMAWHWVLASIKALR